MDDDIVGLGFRPTEEELVDFYLKHMLLGNDPRAHVIPVIDLCDVEPWDVPVMLAKSSSAIRFGDPYWFFFSPVDFKYSRSKRFNRTTKCGFWKATGKDRDIRTGDTNTVIGTKKTLVYYQGRVSCGVKSNWVIHEYHAVTFHESQRTFVLCCLIKKPGKATEGGTDALICDEGEPSRSMVSDFENQATAEGIPSATPWAENCFSPIQQSPTSIEQEGASFPNYAFNNAYFRNEDNVMRTPFETTKEDEFLNSILAGESIVINEENKHNFVHSSTQSESLRRVYLESSDTDAEVISKLDDNIVDISTAFTEYPNSDEYYSSKRFKSSHDTVYGDICFPSSNLEANQEKNEKVNLESIFPTPPQTEEYDLPSLQQSSIVVEQEPSPMLDDGGGGWNQMRGNGHLQAHRHPIKQRAEESSGYHFMKEIGNQEQSISSGVIGKGCFIHLETPLVKRS
ncbi:hypothetical protein JHK87_017508 [Glycine soja]|nr:hypothetical protein JHK87_017508 [Glycine soja]